MDCHDAQPQMTAYLSGDLALEDLRALEVHVASCECCQVELTGFQRTWEALTGFPVFPLDPAVDFRILGQVAEEVAGAHTVPSVAVRWWGIGVAALVAAALSIGNSVLLPYEVAFQWCSRTLRAYAPFADLPDSSFFFVVGIFYGLVPLLVVGLLSGRLLETRPLFHGTAASTTFAVLILPYVIIVCSALPGLFTLSLMGGIVLGALSGGLGGFWAGAHRWRLAHWSASPDRERRSYATANGPPWLSGQRLFRLGLLNRTPAGDQPRDRQFRGTRQSGGISADVSHSDNDFPGFFVCDHVPGKVAAG